MSYARLVATAQRMIAAKGEEVTWVSRETSGGTAAKPGGTVETEHTVQMVFMPLDREYLQSYMTVMTGTEIPTGLVQAYMGQVDFEPTLKDGVIRSSGELLQIVHWHGIEKYDPDGSGAILYIVRFSH